MAWCPRASREATERRPLRTRPWPTVRTCVSNRHKVYPQESNRRGQRPSLINCADSMAQDTVLVAHTLEVRRAAGMSMGYLVEVEGQPGFQHIIRALTVACAPTRIAVANGALVQIFAQRQHIGVRAQVVAMRRFLLHPGAVAELHAPEVAEDVRQVSTDARSIVAQTRPSTIAPKDRDDDGPFKIQMATKTANGQTGCGRHGTCQLAIGT
eukprot:CAMPEP_0170335778 /NCGR_PEP_ID=MMETSP0116_2-20130129/68930_1 /TAXON_ID=400756 /ORGANISM="Durinskia baltica, Strain CSIRO CS-38" /LENGTH=210 /DNA_ID=CAMNT_0010589163 /DNA_START=11 /DNA_END=641 /DNA_ORIENTATION=+